MTQSSDESGHESKREELSSSEVNVSEQIAAQAEAAPESATHNDVQQPGTGFVRIIKMVSPIVEKTTLDLEACRDVVGRLLSDQEVRVAEEVKVKQQELANQPHKPPHPITAYRKATPCGAKWDDMSGTDQFRVCGRCKQFVYDFRDMELAAAEHLVFQREAKEAKKFYMRKDGRFLTSDCPVGIQSGRQIAFSVLAVLLIIGGAIALSMQAPPPEPAKTEAQQPVPENPLPVPAPENPDKSVGFQSPTSDPNSGGAPEPVNDSNATGPAPGASPTPSTGLSLPPPPAGGWPSPSNPQPAGWPSAAPPPGGWPAKVSTVEEWSKLRQQVFHTKESFPSKIDPYKAFPGYDPDKPFDPGAGPQ